MNIYARLLGDHLSHLVFASGSFSSSQAHGRAWQVLYLWRNWINEWRSERSFLPSYWHGHYSMVVTEPYNARVQIGPLISQRRKCRVREENGWPEDTPHLWAELDWNPRSLTLDGALYSLPLNPHCSRLSLLCSASFTLMICSTNSPVNFPQPCLCFSPWWMCELPWVRLRSDPFLSAKSKAESKYAPKLSSEKPFLKGQGPELQNPG